jgi:hypothetical protein
MKISLPLPFFKHNINVSLKTVNHMAAVKKIFKWLFYLIDETVSSDPNEKIAKVRTGKARTVADIARQMQEEGIEINTATIIDIIKRFNDVKLKMLMQGEMVNDGFAIFEPAITGSFTNSTLFDDSRHACVIKTRMTAEVHSSLRQTTGVYSGFTLDNGGAVINGITDAATGSVSSVITPGGNITVTGKKIRIIPEEGETAASCVTYTNLATGQTTVQENNPATNDPGKIVLQLPMLDPGFYTLTIKTLYSRNYLLKYPRYITSKQKLEAKPQGVKRRTAANNAKQAAL